MSLVFLVLSKIQRNTVINFLSGERTSCAISGTFCVLCLKENVTTVYKITHALLPPSGWLFDARTNWTLSSVVSVAAVCWGEVGCTFAFVSPMRALTSDIWGKEIVIMEVKLRLDGRRNFLYEKMLQKFTCHSTVLTSNVDLCSACCLSHIWRSCVILS